MRNLLVLAILVYLAPVRAAAAPTFTKPLCSGTAPVGFVCQDLVVDTGADDWTTAQLLVELSIGSVYQVSGGSDPPTAAHRANASFEFDTSFGIVDDDVSSSGFVDGVIGTAGEIGGAVTVPPSPPPDGVYEFPDTAGIDVAWFNVEMDDFNSNPIARVTLSDDADGTWRFQARDAVGPSSAVRVYGLVRDGRFEGLLTGDGNNDAAVTADDMISVQQNFGDVDPIVAPVGPTGLILGDTDDEGTVTAGDLISVQQNFGATLGPAPSAAVPEPAALQLAIASAALLLGGRRGRPLTPWRIQEPGDRNRRSAS